MIEINLAANGNFRASRNSHKQGTSDSSQGFVCHKGLYCPETRSIFHQTFALID